MRLQRESFLKAASRPERHARGPRSFFVFALVGALGTLGHYVVLVMLVHTGIAGPVVASTIGAFVGALINFVLNHHVTFEADATMRETGPRYVVLVVLSLVNNALLVYLMADVMRIGYLASQVIATALVFFVNFVLSKLWVFARSAEVGS